jgi:four helix bundle protein
LVWEEKQQEIMLFFPLACHNRDLLCRTMFLELDHKKLLVTRTAQQLVLEVYKIANHFPSNEKYAMTSQVRRAALSVYLNISEGCSRSSAKERIRFFEIARGSLIEVDAAFDVAKGLNYLENLNVEVVGKKILDCFRLLSLLIKSTK